MPRYNQLKGDPKIPWLEKLPKKTQILVLMLIILAAAAIQFFMGLHSVHTGQDIVLGNQRISAVESFFWCAACLAIIGGVFAVFMGWAKSSKTDPPA
jgi:ABC-type sulfate transport system permease component